MAPPVHIRWHQGEGLKHDLGDDEILAIASKAKWIVISQDRKWHLEDNVVKAIKQHGARCFYFPCASQTRWVSLCNLIRGHKKMMALAANEPAPFIYRLAANGQFYKVQIP